jgi:MFS family permease
MDGDGHHRWKPTPRDREPNRWAVLAVLGVARLMVVLDATIVTIAIPSAQKALHFFTDSRQWIVTEYAPAFGSLLLLEGKLGDLFGRKGTLIGDSIASRSPPPSAGWRSRSSCSSSRGRSRVFGAVLAPSALSLLTLTFAGSPDRPTVLGIFGAIARGGASLGLL